MRAVVSDSSPLIYLTRLGQWVLLRQLHESVLVPPAVWQEVAVGGKGLPESDQLRSAVGDGRLETNFRMSENLYQQALTEGGE